MKIVHVIPSLSLHTGGPAVAISALCNKLGELGARVELVTTDLGAPAQASVATKLDPSTDLPEIQTQVGLHMAPVRFARRWAYAPGMVDMLDLATQDADVIHIHSLNLHPQFVASRMAREKRIPYVVTPHGALDPPIRKNGRLRKLVNNSLWQHKMLREAAFVQFSSAVEANVPVSHLPNDRRRVVPNGIDTQKFDGANIDALYRETILPGFTGQVILSHGRIDPHKQLHILLKATKQLIDQGEDVKLVLIGADNDGFKSKLEAEAFLLGLQGVVSFPGELRGSELVSAIHSADIWCSSSKSENFGLAVLEAMASGRAVVASPEVAIAEAGASEKALIIAESTPEAFAMAIKGLLENPVMRANIGARAKNHAQQYDWNTVGGMYLQMYEEAIQNHSSIS